MPAGNVRDTRLLRADHADHGRRLSPLAGSLLRLESPQSHMHTRRRARRTADREPDPRPGAGHGVAAPCRLISQGDALAIGMVGYRRELFFGCYADPDALPQVHDLPALLDAEIQELGRAATHRPQPSHRASATIPAD